MPIIVLETVDREMKKRDSLIFIKHMFTLGGKAIRRIRRQMSKTYSMLIGNRY